MKVLTIIIRTKRGIEKVRQFELDFPQIVNDRVVYIAYLQRYYKGRERIFIQLLK
jgi:hypothetical protein